MPAHVTILVHVRPLTPWRKPWGWCWRCALAAAPLLLRGRTDVTLQWRQQQNHYVAFPVSALRTAHVSTPTLLLSSFSLLFSVLLSESQTAAARGSETENTVIVSDENRGGLRERETLRESRGRRVGVRRWRTEWREGRKRERESIRAGHF